jgi:hypothetical protein
MPPQFITPGGLTVDRPDPAPAFNDGSGEEVVPGPPASVLNQADAGLLYEQYLVLTEYYWNSGLAQLPVAGPDGSECRVVKLSAAWGKKIVRYTARRSHLQPDLPSPVTTNPNETLMTARVTPTYEATPDGKEYLFTAEGRYDYALARPVFMTDGLGVAAVPPLAAQKGDAVTTWPGSVFVAGLL